MRIRPLLASAFFIGCAFASSVHALTITQTTDFAFSGSRNAANQFNAASGSYEWDFASFGVPNGQLESITIQATFVSTITARDVNPFTFPLQHTPFVAGAPVAYLGTLNGGTVTGATSSATGSMMTLNPNEQHIFGATFTTSLTQTFTDSGFLSQFTVPAGSRVGLTSTGWGANSFGDTTVEGTGSAVITYNYRVQGVPDVSSPVAMFATCLVLLTLLWHRREQLPASRDCCIS